MDDRRRKKKIIEWNRRINEEFNEWTHALERPSFTVKWLSDRDEPAGKDYSVHNMILGTCPSENEPNYLKIAQVKLPLENAAEIDANNKGQIIQQINLDGEIYKVRYMPQNLSIIATTRTVGVEVYVFDRSKHPSKPPLDGACNPDLSLRDHNAEGFGLSWSNFKQGHLLSTSYGARICLWDINATPMNKTLQAMRIFRFKHEGVEDVAWSLTDENVFGSVSDDNFMRIWDLRSRSDINPSKSLEAHKREVYSLAFSPFHEGLVATGSANNTVKLFDLRKYRHPVYEVGWNPQNANILASASRDRRLMVWDLSRIAEEQTAKEAEDGPPELFFLHGGHTSKIFDFSWNPCEDWVVASVAADNVLQIWQITVLQIWQITDHIYHGEDDEPKESTKPAA